VTAYRPPPVRHWRSYGDDKLPTGAEALSEPFSDRCGKVQMVNEAHARWRDRASDAQRGAAQRAMLIRDIVAKMRHDSCGGRAGQVELITGQAGAEDRAPRVTETHSQQRVTMARPYDPDRTESRRLQPLMGKSPTPSASPLCQRLACEP
jgi:hypothetical protein